MKYNYVYLNTSYSSNGIIDPNDYNAICLRDCDKMDEVQVVPSPLDYTNTFVRRLFNLTRIISRKTKLDFTKLWFPFLIKVKFTDNKPLCFVVSSYNLPISYFGYLKKKYPNAKFVKIYRDLVRVIEGVNGQYAPETAKQYFDYLMSFDSKEAENYDMVYFDEIESKVDLAMSANYPQSDVFIAARAKDRLPKIMQAYDIFSSAGLRCDFYLTGVPSEERIPKEGITYADKNMPYLDMLNRSVNSRCMFDINQGGAIGYTSRFLEAIMYNKKIITDNPFVKTSKFYDERFVQCVNQVADIDASFVLDSELTVEYNYRDEFSPKKLIEQIEELISND